MVVFLRERNMYHDSMRNMPAKNSIHFDRPATYQIKVQGRIDPTWFDIMEGMTISVSKGDGCPTVTTLDGEFLDQAALLGLLNWLYELHLPFISVICLSNS
jgi:hypothetical protein